MKNVIINSVICSFFLLNSTAWATSPEQKMEEAQRLATEAQTELQAQATAAQVKETVRRSKRTWGGFTSENVVYGVQMVKATGCAFGSVGASLDNYAALPFETITTWAVDGTAAGRDAAWAAAESAANAASYDSTVAPAPKAATVAK